MTEHADSHSPPLSHSVPTGLASLRAKRGNPGFIALRAQRAIQNGSNGADKVLLATLAEYLKSGLPRPVKAQGSQ